MTTSGRHAVALLTLFFLGSCGNEKLDASASASASSSSASSVRDAAARFKIVGAKEPVLLPGLATITTDGSVLRPRANVAPSLRSTAHAARVALPLRADGRVELEDEKSGISLEFALRGASSAAGVVLGGHVVYARALGDASVIHRPTGEGTEDFVLLDQAPASPVSYALHLGDRVSGVRVVDRTIELLDETGTPRLRMAPPYVVDASGARRDVGVSLGGCAYDASPAIPYGRAVVSPGARDCTVTLDLDERVVYPALLDPTWTTTGGMMSPRGFARPAVLADGRVLVAGGYIDLDHTPTVTAEVFDPKTRTFAVTGSLIDARIDIKLTTLDDGRVLAFAGHGDNTVGSTPNAEIYDPSTGKFTATTPAPEGRDAPFVLKLPDGRVLVGGGCLFAPGTQGCGDSLNTTVLFDPKTSAWTAGPKMMHVRHAATATLLSTGEVLAAGGDLDVDLAIDTGELLDAAVTKFTPVGDFAVNREFAEAVELPDGRVLVAGGFGFDDSGTVLIAPTSTAVYLPSQKLFSTGPALPTGVFAHSLFRFPSGTIAIPGGADANESPIPRAEVTNISLAGWKSDDKSPTTARFAACAVQMPTGIVLLAGGIDVGDHVLQSAETYGETCFTAADCAGGYCTSAGTCAAKKMIATACAADAECTSGACADGVCCDQACGSQCQACNLAPTVGTCSLVTGKPVGPRVACKGNGPCGGACDGINAEACTYPGSSVACGASCSTDTSNVFVAGACSADGACSNASTPCGAYVCKTTGCPTSCTKTEDCTTGYICDASQKCSPKPTAMASCADEHTVMLADGTKQDCAPYTCSSPGVCLTTCDNSTQCVNGTTCNSMRACAPKPAPVADDGSSGGCGCAVPGRAVGSVWWLAALALVPLIRRRRSAWNSSSRDARA